jgi:uncharacterized protein with HEPN domain
LSKDPRLYLAHILECIRRIREYCADGRDAFHRDTKTQDAVIRNFEVIGEAAKRIPEDFRSAHPSVPWKDLAGFRDVPIHRYESVSIAAVWAVIDQHLPALETAISAVLPPLDVLEKELAGDDEPDER